MNIAPEQSIHHCIAPTGAKLTRFGETPYYAEGLYRLGGGTYSWMVPNGSWGEANSGLVVGKGESLLIDTLWDLRCTTQMMRTIEPVIREAPVQRVINTHSDGDHFWGNQLFKSCEIIATEGCRQQMCHLKPVTLSRFAQAGGILRRIPFAACREVGSWFEGMGRPYHFDEIEVTPANRTFRDQLVLDVGGREVVIIEVGDAHTSGDAMVWLPDERVLFSGDLLFVGVTPVMWAGPLDNWLRGLKQIIALKPQVIVPGHGYMTDLDGVHRVIAYWEWVGEWVTRRFHSGISASQMVREMVRDTEFHARGFARWDSPERIMMSVHNVCRHLGGDGEHPFTTPRIATIMAKQARLAYLMPDASPRSMHRLGEQV